MSRPDAAIQWKNTDVCVDVWCVCGADLHHDGSTSGHVQCPRCLTVWVLTVGLRTQQLGDYPHEPTLLADDADDD